MSSDLVKRKIWDCKIGEISAHVLPDGADAPMRQAVQQAYRNLTGADPDFCFSGWGGELTEPERAVHENREPSAEYEAKWHADKNKDARIEALEGEVAFVKGQLAGTNKNIAGWLQSRDDNLKRAELAEAQLDEALSGCRGTNARAEAAEARAERLREALEKLKAHPSIGAIVFTEQYITESGVRITSATQVIDKALKDKQ
jgi:hypothetical protein